MKLMNILKKYKFESVLAVCLIAGIIILAVIYIDKEKNPEKYADEQNQTTIAAEGESAPPDFYKKEMDISKSDFLRYQVVGKGEPVRAILPSNFCFENYLEEVKAEPPTIVITVDRVVESQKFKNASKTGKKYVTFYLTLQNDYKYGYVWGVYGQPEVCEHFDGEDYIYEPYVEDRINVSMTSCYYEVEPERPGVASNPDGFTFRFDEPGDDWNIYIGSGETVRCKFTFAIDDEKKLQNSLLFRYTVHGGSNKRYANMDYVIEIKPEQIEKEENVD